MSDVDFNEIFSALPDRPLLRVTEVAIFLGITKRTVLRWYPEKLQGTNVNGAIRIYRQSVIELVKFNNGRENAAESETEVEKKLTETSKKQQPLRQKSGGSWVKQW